MKTIYKMRMVFGTGFFSQTGKMITYIHENDGNWNSYFAPLLKYLGGKLESLTLSEELRDKAEEIGDELDDAEVEKFVKEQIKKKAE